MKSLKIRTRAAEAKEKLEQINSLVIEVIGIGFITDAWKIQLDHVKDETKLLTEYAEELITQK